MAITDTDLKALAALSETEARGVRSMPKGIGASALHRLDKLRLAVAKMPDRYVRTPNGSGVLRNNNGRLEILRRAEMLNAAQLAEVTPFTSLPG